MPSFKILPRNRFFEVVGGIMFENRGNDKVAMLSEIDMTECLKVREAVRSTGDAAPSFTALVARAVALTLRDYPYANRGSVDLPFFRRIVQYEDVDITVAVERDSPGLEQATYAGTIRAADSLTLAELNGELRRLSAAEGQHGDRWALFHQIVSKYPPMLARLILLLPHLWPSLWVRHRGGAVMISSPAKYGVDMLVGNWGWPVGISFGLVRDRAMVVEGRVEVRKAMMLIMSFDRRLMAGAPAARFFNAIAERLRMAKFDG